MTAHIPPSEPFSIRTASWLADNRQLRTLRETVFIQEQHVPVELEWDGEDETAMHLLAEARDGSAIGTARMLPDGHIGRVAVLREWRGHGVGNALMRTLFDLARQKGMENVFLDAQVEAIGFYERLGFSAEGEVFMDAGIPHRHMKRSLTT